MFNKTKDQKKAIALLTAAYTRILLHGGSRSGKTFILVRALVLRALKAPGSRHLITRFHFRDAKISIFMDTLPKVLDLCFPELKNRITFNHTEYFVRFPNGSEIWIGGLDEKERTEKILGLEYATIYFNESSQISFHAVETALTRLAQKTALKNKVYFDCNPPTKSHWLYKYFFQHINPDTRSELPNKDLYCDLLMNPEGNRENLPPEYIEQELGGLSERKRRRFQLGEWLDDVEGALWNTSMIDAARVINTPKDLVYVYIGVDPAVTAKEGSNSTGIVAAGVDERGHYYVLDDRTQERASPAVWGTAAVTLYDELKADKMVGEVNNGGDLVERNIKVIDTRVNFESVHATRGKITRAEPIAALYEKGIVHHVGIFPELEEQMTSFAPLVQVDQDSPDRLDAMVWALTALIEKVKPGEPIPIEMATFGGIVEET